MPFQTDSNSSGSWEVPHEILSRSPTRQFSDIFTLREVDFAVKEDQDSKDSSSSQYDEPHWSESKSVTSSSSESTRKSRKGNHHREKMSQAAGTTDILHPENEYGRRVSKSGQSEWKSSTSVFSPWYSPKKTFPVPGSSSSYSTDSPMGSVPRSPSTCSLESLSTAFRQRVTALPPLEEIGNNKFTSKRSTAYGKGKENTGNTPHKPLVKKILRSATSKKKKKQHGLRSIKKSKDYQIDKTIRQLDQDLQEVEFESKTQESLSPSAGVPDLKQEKQGMRKMARRLTYSSANTPKTRAGLPIEPSKGERKRNPRNAQENKNDSKHGWFSPENPSDWRKRLSICRKEILMKETNRLESERQKSKKALADEVMKVKVATEAEWKKKLSMGKREAVAMTIKATEAEKKGVLEFAKDCIQAIEILKQEVNNEKEQKTQLEREMSEAATMAAEAEACWRRRLSISRREVQEKVREDLTLKFQEEKSKELKKVCDEVTKEWKEKLQKAQRDRRLSGNLKMKLAVEQTATEAAAVQKQIIRQLHALHEKDKKQAIQTAIANAQGDDNRKWKSRLPQYHRSVSQHRRLYVQHKFPNNNIPSKLRSEQEFRIRDRQQGVEVGQQSANVPREPLHTVPVMRQRECRFKESKFSYSCQESKSRGNFCARSKDNVPETEGNTINMNLENVQVMVGEVEGSYLSRFRNYKIVCQVLKPGGNYLQTARSMRYSTARRVLLDKVLENAKLMGFLTEFEHVAKSFPCKTVIGSSLDPDICTQRAKELREYIFSVNSLCCRLLEFWKHNVAICAGVERIQKVVLGEV